MPECFRMNIVVPNSSLQNIWEEYNQVRLLGQKKKANKLLADFIQGLKQQEQDVIQHFADTICAAILDAEASVLANNGIAVADQPERIQHPLFREIILPVLAEKYLQNSSRHIKWIGQFEQFFYADIVTTNAFLQQINYEGFFDAAYFFEKAFTISHGQDTLTLLLDQLAKIINYYLHEVPYTVLATPQVLQEALQQFKNYWILSQQQGRWAADLSCWERLEDHWTRYNSDSNRYNDFAHYLSLRNILPD
jgi:hypothetical protein